MLLCAALSLSPAAATAVQPPVEPLRLAGMERLHFEPFDPDRYEGRCDREVRIELAEELGEEAAREEEVREEEPEGDSASIDDLPCNELGVARYRLPLGGAFASTEVTLVQVINWTHLRARRLSWCLYADGRRTSCWQYDPSSPDLRGKMLANLAVHGARAVEGGLVLELLGSMARPQGAFWEHRTDLALELEGSVLRPDHLVRRYLVGRPYDRSVGDEDDWEVVSPPPYAATETLETRAGGVVAVERRVDEVSDADLARCGHPEGEFLLPTDEMERLARCLVESPDAVVRERRLDEPTFIERDWTPPEPRPDPSGPPR